MNCAAVSTRELHQRGLDVPSFYHMRELVLEYVTLRTAYAVHVVEYPPSREDFVGTDVGTGYHLPRVGILVTTVVTVVTPCSYPMRRNAAFIAMFDMQRPLLRLQGNR